MKRKKYSNFTDGSCPRHYKKEPNEKLALKLIEAEWRIKSIVDATNIPKYKIIRMAKKLGYFAHVITGTHDRKIEKYDYITIDQYKE